MDSPKQLNHGPIQIIDFHNPDPGNPNKKLRLNGESISRIFEEAGERPVSIITIAGPSRKGKSFFLDFVIRYLEALENDDSDWMDWDNKDKPLTGFSWRTSIERETIGIFLWSKPFIIKANDKEIAVVLMDTQGTYDELTTEKEMSAIVGLSLLCSSCIIFNFFNDLLEDVFNSLDTYIQYGQLALGENDDNQNTKEVDLVEMKKPFQKLLFLIRDWNMPTQFPYGLKGGKAYLKKKLELKEGLTNSGKKIRETILQCFSELDCCLLPDLGERAKQENFSGSLSQLSPQFCKNLEELINDLLNPDDLPLKSVFGNEVLAVDMMGYLKQYVEVFNGDEIPAPLTLMEATAKISNESFGNKSFRKYTELMKKNQRGKKFMSASSLLKFHKSGMNAALKVYDTARKIGSKEIIESFKDDLIYKIKEAFDKIEEVNSSKKRKLIDEDIEECLTSFRDRMQNEFEGTETFFELKKFRSLLESFKCLSTSDLKEKLEECDEKEQDEAEAEFKKKLELEEERLVDFNKKRKLKAEKKMTDFIKQSCQLYQDEILGLLKEDPYMSQEGLTQHDAEIRTDSLNRYEKIAKVGTKQFLKLYAQQLQDELANTFEQIKNSQQIKLTNLEAEAHNLMDKTIADLMAALRLDLADEINEDGLEKIEADIFEKGDKLFNEKVNIPTNIEFGQKLQSQFVDKLKKTFHSVVKEIMLAKKECEESYLKAVEGAVELFTQELDGFMTNTLHDYDKMKEKGEELEQKALETFELFPKIGSYANPSHFTAKLLTQISTVFEKAIELQQEKKEKCQAQAQILVHEAHHEYQQEMMKNLDAAKNEDDFRDMHNNEKEQAIIYLKDKCDIKTISFVEPFELKLSTDIDDTFKDDLLEVFELKLHERESGTVSALAEARKFYKEEMAKHYNNTEFMRPQDLFDLDLKISKLAIDNCLEKAPLTTIQKNDLELALKETFKFYQEENDANVPVDSAIGIDLGTTYSCVAVYLKGSVKIIPNAQGKNTTPSYVCYDEKGFVSSCGTPAKEKAYENAENTVFDAKRILGRKFEDPEIQNDMKYWTFKVVDDKQVPKIEINKKLLFPEQVSSEVLKEMRVSAEEYLNCTVENAVITVPAYFTDGQRQATIDAGELAGLKVLNILTEPVAAAVAYKLQHTDDDLKHVLIFDLGGGTFDVSILKMSKGNIETLGLDGDTHLGGQDFDQNVMKYCALEFQKEHGIDLLDGKDSSNDVEKSEVRRRLKRLQLECERRKIELASCRSVDIAVDGIHNEAGVSTDLKVTLTRAKFEELNHDLFEKTIKSVEKCLRDANVDKSKIDDIVLVGGSTRIPKIQEMLSEYFKGRALNKTINPDEAVANGAAVQAAIMNGQIAQKSKDYNKIQDISPMSVGIEVYGGDFSIIIHKNTKIPIKFKEQYRTAHNNQTSVQITVYQGEAEIAKNNNWLGEFYLNNIPPADAGRETIEVLMEINLQGVLHVTAVCTSTGDKDSITVTEHKRRMGKDQIKRILSEAKPGAA